MEWLQDSSYLRSIMDSRPGYFFVAQGESIIDSNRRFTEEFAYRSVAQVQQNFLRCEWLGAGLDSGRILKEAGWIDYLLEHVDGDPVQITLLHDQAERVFDITVGVLEKSHPALPERLKLVSMLEVGHWVEEIKQMHEYQELILQQSRMGAVGELLGNLAHHWRQPLNAVGILSHEIKEECKGAEQLDQVKIAENTAKIDRALQFLSKTIDDFKSFYQMDEKASLFSLNRSIGEVLQMMRGPLEAHGITTHVTGEETQIMNYPQQLYQVLLSLLTNAQEAIVLHQGDGGGGEITIAIHPHDFGAEIMVEDNGGGISEEHLEKIFDPYYTTKFKSQGTGLGLYMARTIVEKNLRGLMRVENRQEGACFMIFVPDLQLDSN